MSADAFEIQGEDLDHLCRLLARLIATKDKWDSAEAAEMMGSIKVVASLRWDAVFWSYAKEFETARRKVQPDYELPLGPAGGDV